MRKTYYILLTIFALSLGACDVIEGPFFEDNEGGGVIIVENPQKVLIMDFTGHTCKSCPKAHQTIHMIKAVYEDLAVPIAFHLGYFAKPKNDGKYDTDFRTSEGAELEDYYDFVSFPIGWVNRMGPDDLIPYPSWAAETAVYVQKQAEVLIKGSGSFHEETNIAEATINLADNGYGNKIGKLAVYLVESNIIAYQKNEDASPIDVADYEHNHIFRDAAGSIWGDDVDFSNDEGNGLDFVRNVELNPDWVPENCSFVIFVYNPSTMEVIQVEEIKVML